MRCKCSKIFQAFDIQEQAEILEITRIALGMVFSEIAEEMGLTDEALLEIREKIEKASEL